MKCTPEDCLFLPDGEARLARLGLEGDLSGASVAGALAVGAAIPEQRACQLRRDTVSEGDCPFDTAGQATSALVGAP